MKEKEYDIHLVFFEDLKQVTNNMFVVDHHCNRPWSIESVFGLHGRWGSTLKRKNLLPEEQIPIREDLI